MTWPSCRVLSFIDVCCECQVRSRASVEVVLWLFLQVMIR